MITENFNLILPVCVAIGVMGGADVGLLPSA
jgi:hypothetical protein